MNIIQIFCKANKRNRDDKTISVCGHIIKESERYVEDAYIVKLEGNGILLELTALMNALLDEAVEGRLTKDKVLELYVCNEYIYKTLKGWETEGSSSNKEVKHTTEWQEIQILINQCSGFKCHSTEKKYRDDSNPETIKCMAQLNKLVCEKVNSQTMSE